jgi:phosphoenolpyruvate-protein kinase (PTS system EI component)
MRTKQRGKSLIEANEEVYNAQIIAILDAAIRVGRKNVEIVFPMVESREHLMLGKFLVEKIMMSGLYNKADINIKVIAMIEDIQVFSAPETLINILDEADDINLGTNDFGDSLGQKRLKPETLVGYNPLEYFLYKNIIESAIALGMSPCVCGDLGGDFNWAYALTSLGATVSASSNDLHVVKKALVNAKLKKISELTLKMKDNSKIKIFLDYVADSVKVSTDELINTPTLIAKFYNKLKKSYAKNKDIYRELVLDASEQFGFELQRMQEENLE